MNSLHPFFQEEMERIAELPLPWPLLDGRSIAITGSSGLVGRYLVHALLTIQQKHVPSLRLQLLCRNPESTRRLFPENRGVSFLPYDAREPLKIPLQADYIIHAASNAHPMAFSTDPVGTMQANILGTMRLLENLRTTGGRLLMVSTGEVYGESAELIDGFSETDFGKIDPMRARACYPESKRCAETLCAAYYQQFGCDALAARLTYVFGPSITATNSRADAQFLQNALKGEDIVLKSTGSQVRSWCYAADAVSGLLTILLKGEPAAAYNVAPPECVASIYEYAMTLSRLAKVSLHRELPPDIEKSGYSTVTRAVLRSDRLMALGWVPRYSLEEGLERTLAIARD